MKQLLILLFVSVLCNLSFAQNFNIRGFVKDASNGEPMAFEKVKLLKQSDSSVVTGANSDVNGFYSIAKLNPGQYILKIENPAYETVSKNVEISSDKGILDLSFDLEKRSDVKKFEEVNVSADGQRRKNEVLISQISLDKEGIERIPSVGAENDIVGAISVTPGIITTGDQGGQLYVRGGTPIQNKILLDGMTIYSPFHSIGFFSVFETELIQNTDIYTGGFDAQYGGRISSIMDITYRDGNRKNFGGKVSASPFMAKAVLEGPIGKHSEEEPSVGSYVVSAKHSLLNYTSKPMYRTINEGNGMPYAFTDLYGKLTFNAKGGTKFSAFGFHHRDSVNYGIADLDWQASGGGINFLLVPQSSPLFLRGHVNGSNYVTNFVENGAQPRRSSIGGFDFGFDFTYFLKNNGELNYGFNINGFSTKYLTYNEASQIVQNDQFTTEIGTYVSYRLVTNRFVFQPSMRMQYYASLGTLSLEPRIGAKYNATENFRLKLSGGRYSQNFTSASSDKDVVNLFNGLLSAPNNVQSQFVNQNGKVLTPRNGIQYAWHGILGAEYDISKFLLLNIEGYYKLFTQLSNLNQNKLYEDIAQFSAIDDIYKKDFIIESGQSYGVDFLLKYNKDRIHVWGVYSYGLSERWDGFEYYFPVFDRRHNVNFVATYLFGKKKNFETSLRWNYGSGLPFTPTNGFYQGESFPDGISTDVSTTNPNTVTTLLGDFNSARLPSYHRLDLTLKYKIIFKNSSEIEIIASITNLYNRKNIFYVNRITSDIIYQFPFLPSFGVSYKF